MVTVQIGNSPAASGHSAAGPLLATKLSPPIAGPDLVARPRLWSRLDEGFSRKLTLVSAPAGFGKTTLISDWIVQRGHRLAWVSLTSEDNDPVRFWSYVIGALQTLVPQLVEGTSSPPSTQQPSSESVLTVFINALTGTPNDLVLVLDDYNVIESQPIHNALTFVIDHLPQHVHVVIASRTDPPLPLARLRAKGQLSEVRAVDLSFTVEETTAFFNEVKRLNIATDDVRALAKRTEGWVVGLQLAALSIRGRDDVHTFVEAFAGNHRHVFDYLIEDVLRQQSDSVQTFLLQTSILDRLNGSLCEAVTGRSRGQAMLERLEHANLFTVPLDNDRHWYRYHHLFRDALSARLTWLHPDLIPELHRRAREWCASNGLATEGVGHALAGRCFEVAAELIERIGVSMVHERGENATIVSWVDALPQDVVRNRPRLSLVHAWALVYTGQLEAAEVRLMEVEQALGTSAADAAKAVSIGPEGGTSPANRMLADMLGLRATIAGFRADIPSALALSSQALTLTSSDEATMRSVAFGNLASAYWLSGNVLGASKTLTEAGDICQTMRFVPHVLATSSLLAGMHIVEGRLHEAARVYRQALQLAEERGVQSLSWAGAPHIGLGWLQYEWNDLETASRHVEAGVELAEQGGMSLLILPGYMVLARVKAARGDREGALDILERAEHVARRNDLTHHLARIDAYRVRLWLAEGRIESAGRWAADLGLSIVDELSYRREAEHITYARVLLAQGKTADAIELLRRLLETAESARRMGGVIKISALKAVALFAQGDAHQALSTLDQALTLAQPEGYIRTFVDHGATMQLMLRKRADSGNSTGINTAASSYVRLLLDAYDSESTPVGGEVVRHASHLNDELLSNRELEVLEQLARGRSTLEIAEEFVVAVSTVRSHVKNIYAKLDVHNRMEAVARARERGLLR